MFKNLQKKIKWLQLYGIVWLYLELEDIEMLRQRIQDGCRYIRQTLDIFSKIRICMMRRLQTCIQVQGGHMNLL